MVNFFLSIFLEMLILRKQETCKRRFFFKNISQNGANLQPKKSLVLSSTGILFNTASHKSTSTHSHIMAENPNSRQEKHPAW